MFQLIRRLTTPRQFRYTVVLDWAHEMNLIEEPLSVHVHAPNPMEALTRAFEALASQIVDPEETLYHVVTFRGFHTAQSI